MVYIESAPLILFYKNEGRVGMTETKLQKDESKPELCRSIFKGGCATKEAYTKKWAELIRISEQAHSHRSIE